MPGQSRSQKGLNKPQQHSATSAQVTGKLGKNLALLCDLRGPCVRLKRGFKTLSLLQKEFALLVTDWHPELLHHLQHILPHLPFHAERLVAQHVSGVKRRHQRNATVSLPVPSQLCD